MNYFMLNLWGGEPITDNEKSGVDGAKEVLYSWSADSTWHGFPIIFNTKSGIVRKIFWIFAFVALGAFFVYSVIPQFESYQAKDSRTSVDTENVIEGFFPIVTFCDQNLPYRCDCKLFSHPVLNDTYFSGLQCVEPAYQYNNSQIPLKKDPCEKVVNGVLYDYDTLLNDFNTLGYIPERKLAYYAALNLNEFLTIWSYGSADSTASNDAKLWNLEYDSSLGWACWKFRPVDVQRRPLPTDGFFAIINLNLKWRTKLFEETAVYGYVDSSDLPWIGLNARVAMDDQSPRELFSLMPGSFVSAAVKRNDQRLLEGYGTSGCSQNVSLNLQDCTQTCLWAQGSISCGCANNDTGSCPNYFLVDVVGEANQKLLSCLRDQTGGFFEDFQNKTICRIGKECIVPCQNKRVDLAISAGEWPIPLILPKTIAHYQTLLPNDTVNAEFIRSNLINVRIFVTTFAYQVTSESPAVLLSDLTANVGGQLGLWAGTSLLSILEFFELLVFSCYVFFRARPSNSTDNNDDDNNNKKKVATVGA